MNTVVMLLTAFPAGRPVRYAKRYYLYSVTPRSFIPGLKPSLSANSSHRSLPFLLHDWFPGFPGLFTDTCEHIRFLVFSFFCFSLLSCRFRAVD